MGLKQMRKRPRIFPAWMSSTISTALFPLWGIDSSGTPHTLAMYLRCSGFSMSR